MFCKNCGTQIDDNAAFCPNCGQAANAQPTQPTQPAQPVNQNSGAAKSKLAAGLLGIFLGSLGVHNFYLGYTKRALIQLLVSLLTCGIGATAMGVWGLIEGIFYLIGKDGYTTDANGVKLTD